MGKKGLYGALSSMLTVALIAACNGGGGVDDSDMNDDMQNNEGDEPQDMEDINMENDRHGGAGVSEQSPEDVINKKVKQNRDNGA
ncbi:hypothetical protein EPH95_05665 [Salicibibacter halophilus]|uniref:Lipoprotein n=1 Tax=Salicibibacter halophilus TaxID=2502791 RepID=A0A514LFS0_9BACI|nr:hypothetical protein [Salicibibacter halophilus]QDI90727.1 hypothetical protein EPH95_05665 [Salicibibacter halophilus]